MTKYKVELCRTYYAYCTVEVEAKTEKAAIKKARTMVDEYGAEFSGMQMLDKPDEVVTVIKEV